MSSEKPQDRRDLRRQRAEDKREAERKARQRQTAAYSLAGLALVALVVMAVVAFMGGNGGGGGTPSAPGDVTVSGGPRDTPLATGEPVPSFEAPALGGGTVSWDTYAGRPAVLSLWAPWCPHCQAELPVLDGVMKGYPDVGWVTIATAIDPKSGPSPEAYMQEQGLSFPVAVDDSKDTLARAFGLQVFPTIYFVNSDGTVAREMEGEVDEATLRSTIEALT
jgi:thiol-disulfide isomerase/thioredoxin